MIDLHCHSTASDGSCTPTELVHMAKKIGLSALALTDHDTTAGLDEFLQVARQENFTAIPGVELACRDEQLKTYHLLGLYINPEHPELQSLLQRILCWRNERNESIIVRLNQLGIKISREEIDACCQGEVLGRPHIAKALTQKKICRTIKQAFDKILGRGCAGYVSRQVPSPEECIRVIHAAGGVAVWAHPYSSDRMTNTCCRELASKLKELGLDGIEAYYSLHKNAQTMEAIKIATQLQLLVTGGSDFHGSHFPKLNLGNGYGNLQVPDSLLPILQQKAGHILP